MKISLVYYLSELHYSDAYATLSIKVQKSKNLIKLLALQRPRDNTVSSLNEYRYINYYMCTIVTVRDCMC